MNKNTNVSETSIQVVAGIILGKSATDVDTCLIAKRPANKHQGGLWEFPGGKIENKESAEQALSRELSEELNINIQEFELFDSVEFSYPDKKVKIAFFKVFNFLGDPQGAEQQLIKWVALSELSQYAFPQANTPIVKRLQAMLKS